MVEEYCAKGDLLQLIKDQKRIDEDEGRFLFRQFVEGLRVSWFHHCFYLLICWILVF
jgi:serine/threonine protein kinase